MKPSWLFRCGYSVVLHLYALAMLPKMLWASGKYCRGFWARLGVGFPHIQRDHRPLIWIHAVSLGETKAIEPLLRHLREHAQILLSTTTQTGYDEGKRSGLADYHVYLPFDLPYIICPIVKRVAPHHLILVETDFWFYLQWAAQQAGAHLTLVNGKLSRRSHRRLTRLPVLAHHLMGSLDHYCLQGELYKERFASLGIPTNKMTVTGNLKITAPPLLSYPRSAEFTLTLGSTHALEEAQWLHALEHIAHVKVYIAPRHPERFAAVEQLLRASSLSWGTWSQGASFEQVQVILVDAMGVLQQCYRCSDVAFVGGSLIPDVGGHNLIEPMSCGVPVLYGRHMWGQPDFVDLVQRARAGIEVDATTLASTVQDLMQDTAGRLEMGQRGRALCLQGEEALTTTCRILGFPKSHSR